MDEILASLKLMTNNVTFSLSPIIKLFGEMYQKCLPLVTEGLMLICFNTLLRIHNIELFHRDTSTITFYSICSE